MKALEPYGFAVVPLGADGRPTGRAIWCATGAEAGATWNREREAHGAYLLMGERRTDWDSTKRD